MQVTCVPAHTTGLGVDITTLTGSAVVTMILTAFETAGLPLVQVAFEVSLQVTLQLLAGTKL
jgi:hypothetical protein